MVWKTIRSSLALLCHYYVWSKVEYTPKSVRISLNIHICVNVLPSIYNLRKWHFFSWNGLIALERKIVSKLHFIFQSAVDLVLTVKNLMGPFSPPKSLGSLLWAAAFYSVFRISEEGRDGITAPVLEMFNWWIGNRGTNFYLLLLLDFWPHPRCNAVSVIIKNTSGNTI